MSFAVPTVVVDRQVLVTNQQPDVLIIERAYPRASFAVGPDPRADPRIKAALSKLHKLKKATDYETQTAFQRYSRHAVE